jgi:hypothetical protein
MDEKVEKELEELERARAKAAGFDYDAAQAEYDAIEPKSYETPPRDPLEPDERRALGLADDED